MTASECEPAIAGGEHHDAGFHAWGELWNSLDPVLLLVLGGIVGYIFAISRDRLSAVRSRKIEAITKLHERVLEIERKELSDGRNMTMAIGVKGGTKKREGLLSDDEVDYLSMLEKWRQDLHEEEARARLWIDRRTVRLVSAYFITMMQCKSWEEFGQGNLLEDVDFLTNLRLIFGRTNGVLKKIVIRHSKTGYPRLVDCLLLSDLCLSVIQRRVRLEISTPLCFRVMSLWWSFLEWQYKARNPKTHHSVT